MGHETRQGLGGSHEFQLLAQGLGWKEAALKDQFMGGGGLSGAVQDELAQVECPTPLQVLMMTLFVH